MCVCVCVCVCVCALVQIYMGAPIGVVEMHFRAKLPHPSHPPLLRHCLPFKAISEDTLFYNLHTLLG